MHYLVGALFQGAVPSMVGCVDDECVEMYCCALLKHNFRSDLNTYPMAPHTMMPGIMPVCLSTILSLTLRNTNTVVIRGYDAEAGPMQHQYVICPCSPCIAPIQTLILVANDTRTPTHWVVGPNTTDVIHQTLHGKSPNIVGSPV